MSTCTGIVYIKDIYLQRFKNGNNCLMFHWGKNVHYNYEVKRDFVNVLQ